PGAVPAGSTVGSARDKTVSLKYASILLGKVSHHAVTVLSVFPGPTGYTGAIYSLLTGQRGIAWISNEQNDVILGAIIGSKGQNYTRDAMIAHGLEPAPAHHADVSTSMPIGVPAALSDQQAHALIDVVGFPDAHPGKAPSLKAVAFIDPTQPVSRAMWPALASAVASGVLELQIAPSSLTGPRGADPRSVATDANPTDQAALAGMRAAFMTAIAPGRAGTLPVAPSSPSAVADASGLIAAATPAGTSGTSSGPASGARSGVQSATDAVPPYTPPYANAAVLHAIGVTELPAFVYRGPAGVMVVQGPVEGGVRSLLLDLAGRPTGSARATPAPGGEGSSATPTPAKVSPAGLSASAG
ncbi:MAG: hypothetical protein PHZ23_15555, partial [Acidiphilium sp.]|nr:hypothetical protein [Acidiphilium sp.]